MIYTMLTGTDAANRRAIIIGEEDLSTVTVANRLADAIRNSRLLFSSGYKADHVEANANNDRSVTVTIPRALANHLANLIEKY